MRTHNFQKVNNTIAVVFTFALIVGSASIISKLIWQFVEKDNTLAPTKFLENNFESDSDLTLPFNLFGAIDNPVELNHSQIASTRLNLTLIGILNKKNHPLAIIKQAGGKEKIFGINDLISPSIMLKEVFSKYVIIDHNGSIEKLILKRKGINVEKNNSQAGVQISTSNKLKLKHYLLELKNNPNNLLEVLSVQPNFNNEKLRGFIISPGKEKTLFETLGFQKNDIILSINNNELNNLSQAIKLRKELAQQQTFDFKIERSGQIKYLTLNLN